MLDVLRAVDDDGRRQRRHRDLERAKAKLSLALAEPVEQLVPCLQEPESITSEGQGAWGSSVVKLVRDVYRFWGDRVVFHGSLSPLRLMLDRWPCKNHSAVRNNSARITRYMLQHVIQLTQAFTSSGSSFSEEVQYIWLMESSQPIRLLRILVGNRFCTFLGPGRALGYAEGR